MFDTVVDSVCQMSNVGYITALLLSMVFGMLWYGPIFGEVWCEAQGVDLKEMAKDGKKAKIATLAVYLVMSCVVGYLADKTECNTTNDALWLGTLLWLGFALPLSVVKHAHNPNGNRVVLLLNVSYQLMYFLAQAVCVVYFKHWQCGQSVGDAVAGK